MIDLAKLVAHSGITLDREHKYGFHLDLVNEEEYSAKLIFITKEKKSNKLHKHHNKKETFMCLSGIAEVDFGDGEPVLLTAGDKVTIEQDVFHTIWSMFGEAVVLEVATHDSDEDCHYAN